MGAGKVSGTKGIKPLLTDPTQSKPMACPEFRCWRSECFLEGDKSQTLAHRTRI